MIDGLATATMVASTRIMKKPTSIAHKACHGFSPAGGECLEEGRLAAAPANERGRLAG